MIEARCKNCKDTQTDVHKDEKLKHLVSILSKNPLKLRLKDWFFYVVVVVAAAGVCVCVWFTREHSADWEPEAINSKAAELGLRKHLSQIYIYNINISFCNYI